MATWGTNTDGTGTAPSSFTADNQIFNIRNRATATIGANWTVSGANSKVVLGDGTNAVNFTVPSAFAFVGTIDVSAVATLTLQNSTIPTFGTIAAASTVVYDGAGSQNITAANYGNLTSSNSGARVLPSGTVGIAGTFTPGTNAYTITGNTINFSSAGAQTIPAFNYNNITNTGNGNRTLDSSGTIGIAGTFARGNGNYTVTGSTVDFNGAGAQTITAGSYNNLTISGSRAGSVTLANGTIDITGTFNPAATFTSGNYIITGNTINFSSASSQTIPAFNYNSITNTSNGGVGGNGPRVLDSSGTIGITTSFSTGSGIYTTTGSTVNFNGTSGATINVLNYNNLTVSGIGTFTFGGTFTGSDSITGNYSQTSAATVVAASNASVRTININGNFNVSAGVFILINAGTNNNTIVNIGGSATLSGTGKLNLEGTSSTTGVATFNVTGNFVSTGTSAASGGSNGVVDFGTGTIANNAINIAGNFDKSGAGSFGTTSVSSATGFVFNGAGTQTFSYSGANSLYTQYVVASGSTVSMLTNLTLGTGTNPQSTFTVNGTINLGTNIISSTADAAFTLASGAALITANTAGIAATGATGSIQTSVRNFNTGANYTYNGSAAQITGSGLPATVNDLTFNNSSASDFDITLTNAVSVNGVLGLTDGVVDARTNALTLSATGTYSRGSDTGYVEGSFRKLFSTGSGQSFEFPVGTISGTDDGYTPVNLTTLNVGTEGDGMTVAAIDSAAPGNPGVQRISRYWQLDRVGSGTFTTDMTFTYPSSEETSIAIPADRRLFRGTASACTTLTPCSFANDATFTYATIQNVSTFSPWTVAQLAPLAAPVGVSGRVLMPGINRGVFRARVTIMDGLGINRTVYTNPFGYYRFDDVPGGVDYIFTVSHIRYQFAQPTQIHFIGEDIDNVNFYVSGETNKPNAAPVKKAVEKSDAPETNKKIGTENSDKRLN